MTTSKSAFIDGGRELAELYNKDPLTAVLVQRIIDGVNLSARSAGVASNGDSVAPPPPDSLNVKTSGEMVHVSIIHSAQLSRGIRYFLETDTQPSFPAPIVHDLGSSRTPPPIPLPSLDDSGAKQTWYFRAYAQYPGSKPSATVTLGGANNPMGVQLGGTTKLTLLHSTGSGAASTTGQQGGSGMGKTPVTSAAALRNGLR